MGYRVKTKKELREGARNKGRPSLSFSHPYRAPLVWLSHFFRPIPHFGVCSQATAPVTTEIYLTSSETITQILQSFNICRAHKPITTCGLRQLLTNLKDIVEPSSRHNNNNLILLLCRLTNNLIKCALDRKGAVCKIKCGDCQAIYIDGTGRNVNIQLTEHKQATRNGDINNDINC